MSRTLAIHGHIHHLDLTVSTEDFIDVIFGDILGELFNHDLQQLAQVKS